LQEKLKLFAPQPIKRVSLHYSRKNMAHYARFAANAYAAVDVSTGVASASPHALILMLYDAALKHMGKAMVHMEAMRPAEKGAAITMAIRVIDEGLKAHLDLKQGELALNLKALYEYINNCLLKANLRNDRALLIEARTLLGGLRDSWAAIAPAATVIEDGGAAGSRTANAARAYAAV
jgi:flagellar secretion chaperone FliS